MIARNFIQTIAVTSMVGFLAIMTNNAYSCPPGWIQKTNTCCYSSGCDFEKTKYDGKVCEVKDKAGNILKCCDIGGYCRSESWKQTK